jgi:hypothetical protein
MGLLTDLACEVAIRTGLFKTAPRAASSKRTINYDQWGNVQARVSRILLTSQ